MKPAGDGVELPSLSGEARGSLNPHNPNEFACAQGGIALGRIGVSLAVTSLGTTTWRMRRSLLTHCFLSARTLWKALFCAQSTCRRNGRLLGVLMICQCRS